MQKFVYVTQRKKGAPFVKGFIVAPSLKDAERELVSKSIPVLDIYPVKETFSGPLRFVNRQLSPSVSLKDKLSFSEQMEQCQEIEMSLLVSLDICAEMSLSSKFSKVCKKMRGLVSDGASLCDAMKETQVFEPLALGLVNAGEKSGYLSKCFKQVKDNYRREETIRRKLIKLAAYPCVVLFVAMICVFFLMWKTVPTFVGLFTTANMELPIPTKILMGISQFTVDYPYLIIAGFVAFAVFLLQMPKIYRAFPFLHSYMLSLPIFGKLQRMLIQEVFVRTMYNLLTAGLRTIDALSLTKSISSCYPYKGAIARAIISVSSGSTLMTSLEGEKDIFGIIVIRTLGFGEKTGKMDVVLKPLADTLSNQIMDYIDNLATLIEPLLTVLIGGIVLLILLALFIPIFSLPKLI